MAEAAGRAQIIADAPMEANGRERPCAVPPGRSEKSVKFVQDEIAFRGNVPRGNMPGERKDPVLQPQRVAKGEKLIAGRDVTAGFPFCDGGCLDGDAPGGEGLRQVRLGHADTLPPGPDQAADLVGLPGFLSVIGWGKVRTVLLFHGISPLPSVGRNDRERIRSLETTGKEYGRSKRQEKPTGRNDKGKNRKLHDYYK